MATEPAIHTEGVRHEIRDANIRALTGFGGAIVLTIAIVMVFCWLLFRLYRYALPTGQPRTPFVSSRQLPPEPRLQPVPQFDLEQYMDAQRKDLDSYGWVDQRHGIVRIPIARAMQLLLQRGLPVQTPAQTSAAEQRSGASTAAAREQTARSHGQPKSGEAAVVRRPK